MKISPFAPAQFPEMQTINGVRLATIASGETYKTREDTLLVTFDKPVNVAAVMTTSATCSAAVDWCKLLRDAEIPARALYVNAGNANVFTGKDGSAAVSQLMESVAECIGCEMNQVWHSSTGVIGKKLKTEKLIQRLPALAKLLNETHWQQAAQAIATTDTYPKGASIQLENGVVINGIAKGSGMIMPNMATMLCYVFTNAKLSREVLQSLWQEVVDETLNCITVDGDTSTSDTALLFATNEVQTDKTIFKAGLKEVVLNLAQQIIKDGEGISKFITVKVSGAVSKSEARKVGLSVANSPLVKTAIAGEDANWGRVIMAVGKSGVPVRRRNLGVSFGGHWIAQQGEIVPDYQEEPVAQHLKQPEIDIHIDLGLGNAEATIWTCDLTHGYIDINADYRS